MGRQSKKEAAEFKQNVDDALARQRAGKKPNEEKRPFKAADVLKAAKASGNASAYLKDRQNNPQSEAEYEKWRSNQHRLNKTSRSR